MLKSEHLWIPLYEISVNVTYECQPTKAPWMGAPGQEFELFGVHSIRLPNTDQELVHLISQPFADAVQDAIYEREGRLAYEIRVGEDRD